VAEREANLHRLRVALGEKRVVETVPGPACYRLGRGLRFVLVEGERDRARAGLTEAGHRVLDALESEGPLVARALVAKLRLREEEVARELERLAEAGLCEVRRSNHEALYHPLFRG
jgi:hypothetical protein